MGTERPWVDSFKGKNAPLVHVQCLRAAKKQSLTIQQNNEMSWELIHSLVANTKNEAELLHYFADKMLPFRKVYTWT